MTLLEQPTARRLRRGHRRRLWGGILLALLLVLVFLFGIAFARALDERPANGEVTTVVRTLTPLPQQTPTRTVTVTVTAP